MKFTSLRIKLARRLFKWSVRLAPQPEETEAYKSLPEELKMPLDAAIEVETDEGNPQWTPEQHGNVIIVEPDIMNRYRRGKL